MSLILDKRDELGEVKNFLRKHMEDNNVTIFFQADKKSNGKH